MKKNNQHNERNEHDENNAAMNEQNKNSNAADANKNNKVGKSKSSKPVKAPQPERDTKSSKPAKPASQKTGAKATRSVSKVAGSTAESKAAVHATESLPGNVREEFKWLNNAELQICPDIQRKLDPERVAEIYADYDSKVANPIKVSFRDGLHFIFDGMHTRAAQVLLNGTDDFPIFCRVYYGLTKEDEARLFSKQFGYSEPVPMINRLRALEVAKDSKVLSFLESTRNSGYTIDLTHRFANNGRISAVCEAFKVFCNAGAEEYVRMLKILHKTWAGEKWSVSKFMLSGMNRFMKMYEVSEKKFVSVFREVTHGDILKVVAKFGGMSRDGAFAAAIAEIFDKCSSGALQAKP